MENIECEDALKSTLDYFGGDELAADVFLTKYALRDDGGKLLERNPSDMHRRMAKEFARIETNKFKKPYSEEFIYSYFDKFAKIVPQGSAMFGMGNKHQLTTLANCYVLTSPVDSYGGIHNTDEQLSQISKRRGGTGIDISHLRPINSPTKNSSRTSTGIVPFMERYSNSIREVGQGGRRGALMLTISVHHPEVLNFVTIKQDLTKVTGANISVRLTDEFLKAVEQNIDYEQRWPVDSTAPVISVKVNAKQIWDEIIQCAWKTAEPGLLFWDNIIRESPADCYGIYGFDTVSTNPCSELPLCILDSCRLMLINLYTYVIHPFTSKAYFDFETFYKDCKVLQRLMDDMVDLDLENIDAIINKIKNDPELEGIKKVELNTWLTVREKCKNGRRTGSGITALGDALAGLNIKYGSEEAIKMTDGIYRTLKFGCYRSSVDMAKELGAFPIWDSELEKNNPFLNRIKDETIGWNRQLHESYYDVEAYQGIDLFNDMQKYGRRNIALLTTAPAGTVSTETQTTSGFEPAYKLEYKRRKKITHTEDVKADFIDPSGDKWQEFVVYHHKVKDWMTITGQIDIKESPWYGACAEDIDWINRVRIQGVAQRHIDHAISSTINLPETVTPQEVAKIYEESWRAGLKGITVYRNNCRTGVLVNTDDKTKFTKTNAPKRSKSIPCDIHFVLFDKLEYFVVVGLLDGQPYEIFLGNNLSVDDDSVNRYIKRNIRNGLIRKNKRGSYSLLDEDHKCLCENIADKCCDNEEMVARLLSTSLRHGADIQFVVHQLEKVRGHLNSVSKSVARVLKKYIDNGQKITGEECSKCGGNLIRQEGCVTCEGCGWSKC